MEQSALKRKALSRHEKTWKSLTTYYQVKEADLKRLHAVHSDYMTLWKRQNERDSKEISGRQRRGAMEEWTGGALGMSKAVKLLCGVLCVCPNPQNVHPE